MRNLNDNWKRSPKQIREEFFENILGWILFPFLWAWRGIQKGINWLLWERIRTGDNGVCGPGYHVFYTTKFAWGKLTFFLVVLFIIGFILYEIFLK